MSTASEGNKAVEHLTGALASHDWMSTTTALDNLSSYLSNCALAHDFHEMSRVGTLVNSHSRSYLLSNGCTAEIGKTLARFAHLEREEVLNIKQPAAFQIVVRRFPRTESTHDSLMLYHDLLKLGHLDLCRDFFTAQDVEKITGVSITGSPEHHLEDTRSNKSWRNLVTLSLESIVHCFRKNEAPEQLWLDLVRQDGDEFSYSAWQSENGADTFLALQSFGLNEKAIQASEIILDRPMDGDVSHLKKLAEGGIKLNRQEKINLLINSQRALSAQRLDKIKLSTLISSMMVLDFFEHDDYAFTHNIQKLPEKDFDKYLAAACNYIWKASDSDTKKSLLSLMDETYNSPDRVKSIKPLLLESLFKNLRLGREIIFAGDLGL